MGIGDGSGLGTGGIGGGMSVMELLYPRPCSANRLGSAPTGNRCRWRFVNTAAYLKEPPMNPLHAVQRSASVRRALTGVVALGLVALPACGDDDDDIDTPTDSVVETIVPVDTMAPGDTVVTGDTMAPGDTTAPVDTAAVDATTTP